MKEELEKFLIELEKLDGLSQLYEYSQTILELVYKKQYIKLGQNENSSNQECWLSIANKRIFLFSTTIDYVIKEIRNIIQYEN